MRLPWYPLPDVVSEGVALINADEWQTASYNGTGVKVAILDGGFTGYSSLLGTELPASVTTQSFYAGSDIEGYSVHGTACAEIVYDIAPDADFYLVNSGTDVEMGNAVDWLIAQGVDVISYSMGWPIGGPGDGTGIICEMVDDARAAGILWASSMGNSAQMHWQGDFVDTLDDDFHEFAAGTDETNNISVSSGHTITVALKWDDSWGASANDYDLLLYNNSLALVAWSVWTQDGDDDPWEALSYTATYTGAYHIAIDGYYATTTANFHLYSYYHDLQYKVASSSLLVPADSPNATSVGAVDYSTPTTLELFSSQGPTEDNRIKPDLVAPDGVSTVTYGATAFLGTSASAPHVAGAAALVKECYPSYTPAQIQSFLEGRAVDLGAADKDNLFGSGRLDLGSVPPTMEAIIEAEGQYYNTAPILSNFGFDDDEELDDGWYQMDSYTGSWAVLFTDNATPSWDDDNWPIPNFGSLSEGSHIIYFKASDNASNVEGESGEWNWQFFKDTVQPTDPTSVNSTSHTTSVWSSDNTVDISWIDATDSTSLLDGYSILWNTDNATAIPDTNKDIEEGVQSANSSALTDGNSHYFHIRSVDNAGNWQSTIHVGPFYIDTTPPTDPTGVSSPSHTTSVWSSDNTVDVSWTDATDSLSDLDGYSILWNTDNATAIPDTNKDIEEGVQSANSSALADGNSHYFHIRSKDNAGNWQSTVHVGPFYIDATPPTMEAIAEDGGQYYCTVPVLSNFGFDDNLALDDGWYQTDSYSSGNWTALFTNVPVTDVSDLAVASDNTTIYATDRARDKLYRSTNAGVTWSTVTVIDNWSNIKIDAELVAVTPDDENYIAVAGNSTYVYISDDAGATWDSLGDVNSATGIDSINDIELSVAKGGHHFIAVAGEDGGVAEVSYYEIGAVAAAWTEITTGDAGSDWNAGVVAAAVAFSPNFASDEVMVAVSGNASADTIDFQIFSFDQKEWNADAGFSGYPVTIVSDDGITGLDSASISLAPDYLGSDDVKRVVFVGLTVAGDNDAVATSGIYRLNDTTVTALKTGKQIHSVDYDGTNLVAGRFDSNTVYRSADPLVSSPSVSGSASLKSPGGENRVVVSWAGADVVAGTSGDESAFAVSKNNGETFNDISLIDTALATLEDVAVSADGSKVYLATDDGADLSLWRRASSWERVLSVQSNTGFIIRIAPDDSDGIYVADVGGFKIYYSSDSGEAKWNIQVTPYNIQDLAVESANVSYVAQSGNTTVSKSTDSGFNWGSAKDTGLGGGNIHTIASIGVDKLIVGGTTGYVSYSTDNISSWTSISPQIETDALLTQVTASGLASGDYIYVASSKADTKVLRWQVGTSANWTDMAAPTTAAYGAYGIALHDGVLYVANSDATANSEVLRTSNPTASMVAWSTLASSGKTFIRSPSALRVSTSSTKLWMIDTTTAALFSYSISPPAPTGDGGGGDGGGGGGGGGVTEDARFTSLGDAIKESGELFDDIVALSLDNELRLDISTGTFAKNRNNVFLNSIRVTTLAEPPEVSENMEMIGLAYKLGPAGAYFDPPIDLTIKYDVSLIPEGVAEKNLVVAWCDETASNWVDMESTVDPQNDTISTKISHFSVYTVMTHTRPASFDVADLSIIPKEADLGESVSVSAVITNTGDLTGRYEVSLELDDVVVQTKDVTLDGGDSETVSFSVTPDTAGEHTVYINGLLGKCEVKAPEAPPAPVPAVAPAPPSFAVSDLSVTPSEVKLAEQVTISAVVTNTRSSEGSYTVVLQINGAEEAKKEVTLGAGKSETVTFIISKDTEGSYTVNIDGNLGQFTVIVPPPPTPTPTEALPVQLPTNWWLIGGIIAGCIVAAAGLLMYFFVWRKRGAAQPS